MTRSGHRSFLLSFMMLWVMFVLPQKAAADLFGFFDETPALVRIVEPFLEIKSGPGRGYPAIYIFEKGEQVRVLKERAGWYLVADEFGHEGWAHYQSLRQTLNPEGKAFSVTVASEDDFFERKFDLGTMIGSFEGATVLSLNLGHSFTKNLSVELSAGQVLGEFSQSQLIGVNLSHQPFPNWFISPYASVGGGAIFIKPRATLVQEDSRNEDFMNFAVGARWYLSERYFLRMEYRNYTIFTDRDNNEEAEEWKVGLSVFY